jgi:Tfp pilus assembly protein PilV
MESCRNKSVTLVELIIAIVLVSVIILGINSVNIFSRYHLISSDHRAKLQNDVSFVLEHMTKEVSKAIGNEAITFSGFGSGSVISITDNTSLTIFIDATQDGIRNTANDYWIKYNLDTADDKHELTYCAKCPDKACACSTTDGLEILSKKITGFSPSVDFTKGNYVTVDITGRWDPSNDKVSQDNPEISMRATINLPSVSTR